MRTYNNVNQQGGSHPFYISNLLPELKITKLSLSGIMMVITFFCCSLLSGQSHKVMIDGASILLEEVSGAKAIMQTGDKFEYGGIRYDVVAVEFNDWPPCWIYILSDPNSSISDNTGGGNPNNPNMASVPTLGTWSLIHLGLLLLIVGLLKHKTAMLSNI